jgi:peroxin-2
MQQSAGGGGVIGSAATDITNPYETMPCACIYCFACLAQRIANEEGEGWTCLRCGELVNACRPWSGDIWEESFAQAQPASSGNAKTVGFATMPKFGTDRGDEEEKGHLQEVDPMPEAEHVPPALDVGDRTAMDDTRNFDLGALSESNEWARASEEHSSSDEQSEEYDEDEEEEGEELEFDQ